jgi:hypothetical protein
MYEIDEEPPPRPRMGGRGPAIIGIAVFGMALLVFLAVVGFSILGGEPDTIGSPPLTTPSPVPSSARFAQAGDCVQNLGTDDDPQLMLTACEPGRLEVVRRFDNTTDVKMCQGVQGYRYHYYFDSELAGLDFVLCMRDRP